MLAASSAAVAGGLSGCLGYLPVDKGVPNDGSTRTIHVKPDGSPLNSGSSDDPLESIDRASDFADQGDTVYVHSGEYRELVDLTTGGTADSPFTLTGPPDAVLRPPEGKDQPALDITKSHTHLTGLTITGLHNPDAPENPESYHPGKLISIDGDFDAPDEFLKGLVVSPHRLGGAGQALINSVQFKDSTIGGFKIIGPAGADWIFDDTEGHNGEIVYLGTATDNRVERGFEEYDRTRNIRVHHIDNSEGHPHAELVDCKEGVSDVTVEYCTDAGGGQSNDSVFSTAIALGGFDCTVRWNVIQDAEGPGIEIGPWGTMTNPDFLGEPETDFERKLGTGHAIYGNVFTGNALDAIDFLRESNVPGRETNPRPEDQRMLCENRVDAYSDGNPGSKCNFEHPSTTGVGHLGGESPWDGTVPTADEILTRDAWDPHLTVTVEKTTVTVNETMEIPVAVTNTDEDTAAVELELRVDNYVFDTRQLTIPSDETKETTFTNGGYPRSTELSLLRNGQKVAAIEVREA